LSHISVKELSFIYAAGTPFEKHALKDINVEVAKGSLTAVIGHTGSGKSTLVQHLNGLLKPTSGQVFLDDKDIWQEPKKIRDVRFKVGLVFQYPEYQLFDETVEKDISFGPKNMGLDEDEIKERVQFAAGMTSLDETVLSQSPFELSGGQKRRAAIAGVMAMKPSVIILDEPTAGLDPRGRDEILGKLSGYQKTTGTTMLLVSHSMEDVSKLADYVLVMNDGQVAMYDTVDKVYSRAGELKAIGLNVPQVTKIFTGLKSAGVDVKENVFTMSEGKKEICRVLNV